MQGFLHFMQCSSHSAHCVVQDPEINLRCTDRNFRVVLSRSGMGGTCS